MTEKDKRVYIIGGTVLLAVLLWLLLSGRGRQVIGAASSSVDLPSIIAPPLGDIVINRPPIVIPGLDLGGRDLQMIGSCCMDCSTPTGGSNSRPRGTSFVYNAGDTGPNIYDYRSVTVAAQSSGSTCPPGYSWRQQQQGGRMVWGCYPW